MQQYLLHRDILSSYVCTGKGIQLFNTTSIYLTIRIVINGLDFVSPPFLKLLHGVRQNCCMH